MARTDSGLALIQLHIAQNAFVKALGMTLTIHDEGVVSYALTVTPSHLATPGFVHGGVLTTLLDATMGAGALTLVADEGQGTEGGAAADDPGAGGGLRALAGPGG